jgi:hypothetical protein
MVLSRKRNQACQLIAIALRTFLIGVFFFASHVPFFAPLGDDSPLHERRLVSPKEFIENAALSRGFKSDGSQNRESFFSVGVRHHVQVQRAAMLHLTRKLGVHEPPLSGSFLIRSPPPKHDN